MDVEIDSVFVQPIIDFVRESYRVSSWYDHGHHSFSARLSGLDVIFEKFRSSMLVIFSLVDLAMCKARKICNIIKPAVQLFARAE